jgi:hypothetical protein
MRTASKTAAVLAMAALLTVSCTRIVDDAKAVPGADLLEAAATDNPDCQEVDAQLATVESRSPDEPVLKIPQPDGWERTTMMDSELIRFAMSNASLGTPDFAPTAVVTLESGPGLEDPEVVFANQRDALESGLGATDIKATDETLCGLPAEKVTYQMPPMGPVAPHPAMVMAAVFHSEDTTFVAAVTVQTTDPQNPGYQNDAEKILSGFQILPPSKR